HTRLLGLDGPVDRLDGVTDPTGSTRVQELEAHDADRRIDADHADLVVPDGADRPRDVCAVVVVVQRIARVRDGVVAVAPGRTAVDRAGIRPDVRSQVRVVVVDAGVDDADDDRSCPHR